MSAMIYDTTEQAFVEAETPMKFDADNQIWADTTGMAYNQEVEAWEEKWRVKVSIDLLQYDWTYKTNNVLTAHHGCPDEMFGYAGYDNSPTMNESICIPDGYKIVISYTMKGRLSPDYGAQLSEKIFGFNFISSDGSGNANIFTKRAEANYGNFVTFSGNEEEILIPSSIVGKEGYFIFYCNSAWGGDYTYCTAKVTELKMVNI